MEVNKDLKLAEGWLNRQLEIVRRNVAEWPASLKRAAGIADVVETKREAWDKARELEDFLTEQIHVFELLSDEQITPRKAIESLVCYRAGNVPALPERVGRLEHGQGALGVGAKLQGTITHWQPAPSAVSDGQGAQPWRIKKPERCECGHVWHGSEHCAWTGYEAESGELVCECPESYAVLEDKDFSPAAPPEQPQGSTFNSVYDPATEGSPSCHVCGANMIEMKYAQTDKPAGYKCESCGATTEPSGNQPQKEVK